MLNITTQFLINVCREAQFKALKLYLLNKDENLFTCIISLWLYGFIHQYDE